MDICLWPPIVYLCISSFMRQIIFVNLVMNYTWQQNLKFNIYSPTKSSTSQKVPCSSSFCEQKSLCSVATSGCPYMVQYASENTTSAGFLVEDILYFKTEETIPKVVKAPIVFGYVYFLITNIQLQGLLELRFGNLVHLM